MERPWSLYNKAEKLRIDDLRPEQVRTILLSIPASQIQNWYACQEGDLQWAPLRSVSEFYRDLHGSQDQTITDVSVQRAAGDDLSDSIPANTASVAKTNIRRPLFEDPPEGLQSDPTLEITKAQTNERRLARRYPRKLDFKATHEDKVFTTRTLDISMGGMSLETIVPDWLPRTFRAELSLNDSRVRIVCKRINANQLRLMEAGSWDLIRQWLVMG